jgi:Phage integrase, N-terminal SAM-like domain
VGERAAQREERLHQGPRRDPARERFQTVHEGSYRELQDIRFADFADKWLKEYVRGAVKRTTYQTYDCHVRVHFKPAFGALALRALREDTM